MFSRLLAILTFILIFILSTSHVSAVTTSPNRNRVSPTATVSPTPTPVPAKPDLTEKSEETTGPLEKLLNEQKLDSPWILNPVKYAIRGAVGAGVPPNTIVLLLLLPLIATVIAMARHLVGLRGFGIFLPAALSVVFVATGPLVGIMLFLIIVVVSTSARIILRRLKIRLQYLPRMALLLWFVVIGVLGILFMSPLMPNLGFADVSIFPVLILVLLAEDFTRVQLGKSVKTAMNLTSETIILAFVSYLFLTFRPLQKTALLNPEILLFAVAALDFLVGRYVGLRVMEIWRFRKLITQ